MEKGSRATAATTSRRWIRSRTGGRELEPRAPTCLPAPLVPNASGRAIRGKERDGALCTGSRGPEGAVDE